MGLLQYLTILVILRTAVIGQNRGIHRADFIRENGYEHPLILDIDYRWSLDKPEFQLEFVHENLAELQITFRHSAELVRELPLCFTVLPASKICVQSKMVDLRLITTYYFIIDTTYCEYNLVHAHKQKIDGEDYELVVDVPHDPADIHDMVYLNLVITRKGRVFGNGRYVATVDSVTPLVTKDQNVMDVFDIGFKDLAYVKVFFQPDGFVRGVIGEEEMINYTLTHRTTTTTPCPSDEDIYEHKIMGYILAFVFWLVGALIASSIASIIVIKLLKGALIEGKEQLEDEEEFAQNADKEKVKKALAAKTPNRGKDNGRRDKKNKKDKATKDSNKKGTKNIKGTKSSKDTKSKKGAKNKKSKGAGEGKNKYVTAADDQKSEKSEYKTADDGDESKMV
ncbi:unnamed protein product [Bursaphelenchus okinawaensis]|uniref:Uncharacterized protein n=1 Tax=Bursaphelenchus okinawaensis TaxID=465554 RepID=A0A811L875_9BILA|nr:unnamed protein product [Bursaphelenchus okinawaensis]CAG9118946.1 unnamed protein product [Bursaphelenchus okinawaensis]